MRYIICTLFIFTSFNIFSQNSVAVDDYFTTDRGEALVIDPLANDRLVSSINLRYASSPKLIFPAYLSTTYTPSVLPNGLVQINLGKDYYGKLIFKYVICDADKIDISTFDTAYIYIDIRFKPNEGYDSLDINNLSVGVVAGGELFTDLWYGHFREKGVNKSNVIFKDNLWMGGYDDGGNLKAAAQTYRQQGGYDYDPGPVYGKRNSGFFERYVRTWKISKEDIINHLLNHTNSGYNIQEAIENWPAYGMVSNGESYYLSPYLDFNNNSLYDPENGDCPCLLGDQIIYYIFNDNIKHGETGGEPLNFEIHTMVYAYQNSSFPALYNTIFVRYKIINRSFNDDYDKLVFGKWIDFDDFYSYDDHVGCDTSLNSFYSYNASGFDSTGFGRNPPAIGVSFLNHDMTSFIQYNNDFSLNGNPSYKDHYYYYQTSRFKNRQPMRYGGDGFNDVWEDRETNFMYPSHPNDSNGWSEVTANTLSYRSLGLGSTGKYSLGYNDTFTLDLAYVYARDKNKDNIENLDLLLQYISEIRDFYKNNPPKCASLKSIGIEEEKSHNVKIYPNPAKDYIIVDGEMNGRLNLEIISANGKIVFSKENINSTAKVDISQLDRGAYIVKISNLNELIIKRLIVL
jgi:hypothetical protein